MAGLVLRDDIGSVVVLTLNRPEKLNALSPELFADLAAHIGAIEVAGEQVRCIVLKGAGRSFCAGADIEVLKAGVVTVDPEFRSKTVERLGNLPQPVIAAVHGHCYTGGLELALTADIIVAADNSRFCDTHAKLGIVPRWGLSARLPRRVGLAAAKKLSLTCEPIDAKEALRIGLADHVVPAANLDDFALTLAAKLAENSIRSIAAIKHLYEHCLTMPLDEALAYERDYTKATKVDPGRVP